MPAWSPSHPNPARQGLGGAGNGHSGSDGVRNTVAVREHEVDGRAPKGVTKRGCWAMPMPVPAPVPVPMPGAGTGGHGWLLTRRAALRLAMPCSGTGWAAVFETEGASGSDWPSQFAAVELAPRAFPPFSKPRGRKNKGTLGCESARGWSVPRVAVSRGGQPLKIAQAPLPRETLVGICGERVRAANSR